MIHVFDVDGCLLDTPRRKTEAFYYAALPYGEDCARAMVRIHRTAGSVGRQARWERFFAGVLHREPKPGEMDEVMRVTTEYVMKGVELAEPLPGVKEYLATIEYPIVVSGIEQEELGRILDIKGFNVARWYGGDKNAILSRLIADGEIALPAYYYGDERTDLEVSTRHGMRFVFVSGASEWAEGEDYCRSIGIPVIRDFLDPMVDNL